MPSKSCRSLDDNVSSSNEQNTSGEKGQGETNGQTPTGFVEPRCFNFLKGAWFFWAGALMQALFPRK